MVSMLAAAMAGSAPGNFALCGMLALAAVALRKFFRT